MLNFNGLQGPESGIASALEEPSRSLAQDSAITSSSAKTRLEQQAAIIILLDQHDDIILAYLKFARSLNRNLYYLSGYGSLSKDQVLAVCALRDCNDNEIKAWLKQARKFGETAELALELQELTLTSKRLWTIQTPSRRYRSRAWLCRPFFIRAITRDFAFS